MFAHIRKDSARYSRLGGWMSNSGFWITAIYRLGVWAHGLQWAVFRIPMWLLYRIVRLSYHFYNVELWAGREGAKIGPGICLIHANNIYIGPGVSIGENCKIFHEVTLGMGHIPGTPQIGNNVDIFVGARVLGGISIGNNCMIGANCVVTKNVPDDMVVMSAPNRSLPRSMSPRARDLAHDEDPGK
jgi:serine O-acetyltransferase